MHQKTTLFFQLNFNFEILKNWFKTPTTL
jgi:hypothetical protein